MNAALTKVVTALRDPKYRKVTGKYCDDKNGFCGVGLAVFATTGNTPLHYILASKDSGIPEIGLVINEMIEFWGLPVSLQNTMFSLNDAKGLTLPEIADYLEQYAKDWSKGAVA